MSDLPEDNLKPSRVPPEKRRGKDVRAVLDEWEFEPGTINVRKIQGDDGEPKIQMRLDLGLLQMELNGRPDGRRPFGCDSLLDYYETQLSDFKVKNGSDLGFILNDKDCQSLREEAVMYYHRYLSLFVLEEFGGVIRDTSRNLRVLDMCGQFAENEQDRLILEQYRPYITMMNTRAKASVMVKDGQFREALELVDDGLESLKAFYERFGQPEAFGHSNEVKILKKVARDVRKKVPVDPMTKLKNRLEKAIKTERYEEAAKLRDEIKRREMQSGRQNAELVQTKREDMRAIVTGQVGVDKGPYLQGVQELAKQRGIDLVVCNVGKMMYEEAPDVPAGRILNLPITRLNTLRRAVFKEILRIAEKHEHVIVNTHATFRWRHGLFPAFDFDQTKAFNADLYITMLDNAESVHQRLAKDHDIDHTLKDIMVWREEELLATEILANILQGYGHFYMISRGRLDLTTETVYRLLFEGKRKKVYLSFPMSHVMDLPDTLAEIDRFKRAIAEHFIVFDPADVDEFVLHMQAEKAFLAKEEFVTVEAADGPVTLPTAEVMQISGDIMGQIYARDFKMVDQSEMIISLVPELPNGKPGLSSGVERELHHAFEGGKEVFIVWACRALPSPFITETATKVFKSTDEAIEYFKKRGYIKDK